MAMTLFEKIWRAHTVHTFDDGSTLLYIDRHLIHEVTSPQAFEGMRQNRRPIRRPDLTFATMDHNVPTTEDRLQISDPISRTQVEALQTNTVDFNVPLFGLGHPDQGIVHVIGPELGLTLPGQTLVCGDSHTSTHGAFGALAFGIGTSEVEHVLATQTLVQSKPGSYRVEFSGRPPQGITSKDMILKLIGTIGTAGGTGHVLEYCGEAVTALSMEQRMSLCNMSIEAGARAGMIAPDETTFNYITSGHRPYAPQGEKYEKALAHWRTLPSDEGASFDRSITIDTRHLAPQITWGTNPGMVIDIDQPVPSPENAGGLAASDVKKALDYIGLEPGTMMTETPIDVVFIGSCTNGRIEDLRCAAEMLKGRKVAAGVEVLVVPGSARVKAQAEAEGLDTIFKQAGASWRFAGCSMCLGMNPDQLQAGQRCASTSNRNFEGRQGKGGRTHLVSPAMAAAAAVAGRFVDIRTWPHR